MKESKRFCPRPGQNLKLCGRITAILEQFSVTEYFSHLLLRILRDCDFQRSSDLLSDSEDFKDSPRLPGNFKSLTFAAHHFTKILEETFPLPEYFWLLTP